MAALGRVNYPGYSNDLVALGIIEEITPNDAAGFTVTLRHAGDKEATLKEIARRIHEALAHDLGVAKVEFKVHKIEPELGEKTGAVAARRDALDRGRGERQGRRRQIDGRGESRGRAEPARLQGWPARRRYLRPIGADDVRRRGRKTSLGAAGKASYPIEQFGIKLISIGFFLTDKTPVIWRGPMVMSAVRQFLKDTLWGTQDFLIVDLPPGTGDAQLTLAQQVALDGVVIVTTPQDVALADALRAVRMFRQVHCPLLGVVENMSYFVCPDCGERDELFGHGGGDKMGRAERMELLAELPLYSRFARQVMAVRRSHCASPEHPASLAFIDLARRVADAMPRDC